MPDPVLCRIKSVYIDGNSESAHWMRKVWPIVTKTQVAASKDEADATLDINTESSSASVVEVGDSTKLTISVLMKDRKGKQL